MNDPSVAVKRTRASGTIIPIGLTHDVNDHGGQVSRTNLARRRQKLLLKNFHVLSMTLTEIVSAGQPTIHAIFCTCWCQGTTLGCAAPALFLLVSPHASCRLASPKFGFAHACDAMQAKAPVSACTFEHAWPAWRCAGGIGQQNTAVPAVACVQRRTCGLASLRLRLQLSPSRTTEPSATVPIVAWAAAWAVQGHSCRCSSWMVACVAPSR